MGQASSKPCTAISLPSLQDHCKCCRVGECQDWCNFGNFPIWTSRCHDPCYPDHHCGRSSECGCGPRSPPPKDDQGDSFGMNATAEKKSINLTAAYYCH